MGNDAFDVTSHLAATDMANDIRNNRIDGTLHDNEIFGKEGRSERRNPVVIAAVPDTGQHPLRSDGDRQVLEVGWLGLALSTHPDAVAAIEVGVGRQPDLLPFGALTEVPVRAGAVSERWARRLTMCDPTAAHVVLAQGKRAEAFFLDPLTDMPVLRTDDREGQQVWRFYAPLSSRPRPPNWPRSSCTPSERLWWGDGWGDRPSEAATVINLLLDDLGAVPNLREHWNAPKGLTALLNEDHKQGTELTRSTLLHARMTPPRTR
ncbi:hypothetical protein ACGFZL_31975 [Streptomyces sp. NPDC048182]|uniref:hypothetical protein n=1 Tax=Streptomyces sp. NPDC048182 TaxID=3365507 RepID=UPI0037136707